MSNFFILGMPRSRTTWLSAFMHSDLVFCNHETFSYKDFDASQFWEIEGYEYKGSVDNDPRYSKPYLVDKEAKLVIVKRDYNDVYKSLVSLGVDPELLKIDLDSMYAELEFAESRADLVVDFKSLDNSLPEICQLCTPNIGYDKVKHTLFKNFYIEPRGIDPTLYNGGLH
jgi:hypothetical protein